MSIPLSETPVRSRPGWIVRLHCAICISMCTLIACAGVEPRPSSPCDLTEGAAGESVLLRAGRQTTILTLDKRPIVVPRERRGSAGCDLRSLLVLTGDHEVQAEFQIAGWSPLVAEAFAVLTVPFEARAGHQYEISCEKLPFSNELRCRIGDLATDAWAGSARSLGLDPNPYFDLLRGYAACGDEVAWVRLQHLKASGQISKPREQWEPGRCNAFIDLRR